MSSKGIATSSATGGEPTHFRAAAQPHEPLICTSRLAALTARPAARNPAELTCGPSRDFTTAALSAEGRDQRQGAAADRARSSPRAPPLRAACRPQAGGNQFKSAASRAPPGAARLGNPLLSSSLLLTRRPHPNVHPTEGNGAARPRRRRSLFERPGAPASFPYRRSSPLPAATNPLGPGRKLNLLPRRRSTAPSAVTAGTAAAPPPPSAREHGGAGASGGDSRSCRCLSLLPLPDSSGNCASPLVTGGSQQALRTNKRPPLRPPRNAESPAARRRRTGGERRAHAGSGCRGRRRGALSRTANAAAGPAKRRPLPGSETPPRPAAGRGAGAASAAGGLPPPRPRFNGRHGVRFSLGAPRGQSAAPRAGGARRELPRGHAKFAPRPPRGRSRPARL